jgi:Na+/proline symporter
MTPPPSSSVALYLGSLLGYSVLLVGFGLFMSRRVQGSGSFFVADRKLGPGLMFSTFLAANIGAGSVIGASGLGYRGGISAGIGSLLLDPTLLGIAASAVAFAVVLFLRRSGTAENT